MMWKFPLYEVDTAIDWQQIEATFDWFRDMQGVPQDPIWHAEGDVFVHTKMVVEALINLPEFNELNEQDKHVLVTAALMHDIEKRSTTTTEIIDGESRIVSPRHAKKGEFTARTILYREMDAPFEIREQIAKLVRLHGLPLWAIEKENPVKEVLYASQVVNTEHLSMLAKADILGRICQDEEDILFRIELFNELCKDHQCFGKNRQFPSGYGRFQYFNKSEVAPDYTPFDDLKFDVYLLCALPGSGKDRYIQQHLQLPVLSLDDIRREHKINPTDKKKNGQVIQMGQEKAREFMRAHTSFVFNATNITGDMRNKWISLFTEYGGRVTIVYIEVPYRQLLSQNRNREYPIPAAALEKMIGKLEIPTYREAHEIKWVVQS